MYEYRQVIHRMRMGQSDRAIAKTKLMGRLKCGLVRAVAEERGWLGSVPLPDDCELARIFESEKDSNPTRQSLSLAHEDLIQKWVGKGIWATTIHRALVEQFAFTGSYSSVRRLVQKVRKSQDPKVTCILDFAPGSAAQVDFGTQETDHIIYGLSDQICEQCQ